MRRGNGVVIGGLFLAWTALSLAIPIGVIYVAIHFIRKFW